MDPTFSMLTKFNAITEGNHIRQKMSDLPLSIQVMKRIMNSREFEKLNGSDLLHLISTEFHAGMREKLETVNMQLATADRCEPENEELEFTLATLKSINEKFLEHVGKEERLLFPLISIARKKESVESEKKNVAEFIVELKKEHNWLKNQLQLIRKATNDYQCQINSSPSHKLAYAQLHDLEQDFNRAFFVEEEYLFPRLLRIHHK